MLKKLKQITDSVHGTIYLSEFESHLIATPFFNRLHDVYQCSTAYMTYPSNRTKRFEHSLGTMELASEIMFFGIANASKKDRDRFFLELTSAFDQIIKKLGAGPTSGPYQTMSGETKRKIRSIRSKTEEKNKIRAAVEEGSILDSALCHFMPSIFGDFQLLNVEGGGSIINTKNELITKTALDVFLYQCILQAIRIVALFHDIGHPPHSHIIEETLQDIAEVCMKHKDGCSRDDDICVDKRDDLLEKIGKIREGDRAYSTGYLLDTITPYNVSELHENIGIKMFNLAIDDFVQKYLNAIMRGGGARKTAPIYHHIIVMEFAQAILVNKTPFFADMHQIVSGVVDTDRLDYVNRDTQNSGVNWGKIPYKRLIESARLMQTENSSFVVAFPQKMSIDIDDFLAIRYKIFARIAFHHRTVKTAKLLQNAVMEIAKLYLHGNEIGKKSDIENLWKAPGDYLWGDVGRIATWNDTWLIDLLYKVMGEVDEELLQLVANNQKESDEYKRLIRLQRPLKEVLLNEKHFYSLYKRGHDTRELMQEAVRKSGVVEKAQANLENLKKKWPAEERGREIRDTIHRLEAIGNCISYSLGSLNVYLPIELQQVIEEKLSAELADNSRLEDFFVEPNNVRNKLGVSFEDDAPGIYLYDDNGTVERYNTLISTIPMLAALLSTCSEVFVYVCVKGNSDEEARSNVNYMKMAIVDAVAKALSKSYDRLFMGKSDAE